MASPTHVGTGTIVAGTTNSAPAYPASINAGDLIILAVTSKPDTSTYPAIAGWTKQLDVSVGSGTVGGGTGPQRLGIYTKIAAGGESGTVTVTPATVASNVCEASIAAYRLATPGTAFSIDVGSGSMTTASTSFSTPNGSSDRVVPGDTVFFAEVVSSNQAMSGITISALGAGFSAAANNQQLGTANGNDLTMTMNHRASGSGAATAATTAIATITSSTGGTAFVRMREVPAPGTLPDVVMANRSW